MMTYIRWGLAAAVGLFLLFFGYMKVTGAAFIFPYIEYRAGELGFPMADMFYPLVNYLTGALEIGAGLLTLVPVTRKIGSVIAVAPFLGAVGFHLTPLLGVMTPADFNRTPALEAHLRAGAGFVREDFTAETAPVLFIMAAVMLCVAVVNAIVQRRA